MTAPAQPSPTSDPPALSSPQPPPAPQSVVPAKGRENGPDGFPVDTPIAEMTDAQAAAYWKHKARKHEGVANSRADYDELKAKAAEADRLRQERETETEKKLREATEQVRRDADAVYRPKLAAAHFAAAAAGRIDADRLATLTEDIDMARYVKDDGSPDLERIRAKVDAWAPPVQPPPPELPRRGVRPDPTQGPRGGRTTGTDVGREMFEARRKRHSTA